MGPEERRARLAWRHRLAPPAGAASASDVAASLVALHSTDPASVHLACLARLAPLAAAGWPASVDTALYDERSIVRMLGMRRTVFVVPTDLEPVVHAACTRAIAATERAKLVRVLDAAGLDDAAAWLVRVEAETVAALEERGEALGQELSAAVPALRTQITFGDGTKKWGGPVAITTRVLFLLAADGRTVRGRPRGSWTSSQYRWAPRDRWLGDPQPQPPAAEARDRLARRWLAAYGPATVKDLQWWSGWTVGETRSVVARIQPVEVDLDGTAGMVLAEDVAPEERPPGPWVALLPALDPTVMGWSDRSWFLDDPELRALLFDRSGNAGPTIWCDGQVVGGWAQRFDGEIATAVYGDVGAEAGAAIDEAAGRLGAAIGPVRVTPRFRTPLERQLVL